VISGDGKRKIVMSFRDSPELRISHLPAGHLDFTLDLSPSPQDRRETTDPRGNRIVTATWTIRPRRWT
jgi:hypothetical protein